MHIFCGRAREVGAAFEFEFVAALRTFTDSRMKGGRLSLTYFSAKMYIKSYRECLFDGLHFVIFFGASAASTFSVNFWVIC